MFKKLISSVCVLTFLFAAALPVYALSKSEAIDEYVDELPDDFEDKQGNAESTANSLIESMEASQAEVVDTLTELDKRVKDYNSNDPKKDSATEQLKTAKDAVDDFEDMNPDNHLDVVSGGVGVLPQMIADEAFQEAEENALTEMSNVNRILISPSKPGNVPEGDILEDFLPQLIRQLFRFAWVAVFVALVVSGVFFVISFDNEERATKAKHMIYFSLIGFAAVTLAFAIVKAVSDIDFFNFI